MTPDTPRTASVDRIVGVRVGNTYNYTIMATTMASDAFAKRSMRHGLAGGWLGLALGTLCSLLILGCAGSAPEIDGGGGQDAITVPGCANAANIFKNHTCTTVCHLAANAASVGGGFDMTTSGWEKRLVGNGPSDSAPSTNMCKGKGLVYLKAGIQPATGLFIDKLKPNPPCGVQMPQLLAPLAQTEIDCVQMWANNVVAGGTGQ